MPELPDVEAIRTQVQKSLKNRRVRGVKLKNDPLVAGGLKGAKLRKVLLGARFQRTGRHGKYFWIEFVRRPSLLLHMGMTGYIEIKKAGDPAPKKKRTPILELDLDDGSTFKFFDPRRFGRVWLVQDPTEAPQIRKLGPDPLRHFTPTRELYKILHARTAPIKALLLDQTLFAGVGNWVADEILYQARISPLRPAKSLSEEDVGRLRAQVLKVNRRAVALHGDSERYPKDWLFHYRWSHRKGAQTARHEPIVHSTVGGRTTAWVPSVQE